MQRPRIAGCAIAVITLWGAAMPFAAHAQEKGEPCPWRTRSRSWLEKSRGQTGETFEKRFSSLYELPFEKTDDRAVRLRNQVNYRTWIAQDLSQTQWGLAEAEAALANAAPGMESWYRSRVDDWRSLVARRTAALAKADAELETLLVDPPTEAYALAILLRETGSLACAEWERVSPMRTSVKSIERWRKKHGYVPAESAYIITLYSPLLAHASDGTALAREYDAVQDRLRVLDAALSARKKVATSRVYRCLVWLGMESDGATIPPRVARPAVAMGREAGHGANPERLADTSTSSFTPTNMQPARAGKPR